MSKHMDHVANLRTRVEMQKLSLNADQIVLNSPADRVQVIKCIAFFSFKKDISVQVQKCDIIIISGKHH